MTVWAKPIYATADAAYTEALRTDPNDRMSALAAAVDVAISYIVINHINAEIADNRMALGEAVSDNNYLDAATHQIAIDALTSIAERIEHD